MEKRKILLINYIILGVLVILTMMITFNVANKYKEHKEFVEKSTPLNDLIYQVKLDELDNYLLENPDIIIYLAHNKVNDKIKSTVKDLIITNNLRDEMIFIDITNFKDKELNKLNSKISDELLKSNIKIGNYVNFIKFKNRKIIDILKDNDTQLENENIIVFLQEHEAIEK